MKIPVEFEPVIGLCYGDEAKARACQYLIEKVKRQNYYDFVAKFNGGPNAGHTIYINDQKVVFHQVPIGVVYNIPSVIGSGCVVHISSLLDEIDSLEKLGINASKYLKVAYNAHLITDKHIEEDIATDKIGSTGRGIMPAYRDKYGRIGKRAQDDPDLKEFLCDPYELFYRQATSKDVELENRIRILGEGGQGFMLCPDNGKYPYVSCGIPTSTYALHSLNLDPQSLSWTYGCIKAYNTYVGTMKFQPEGEIFNKIAEMGREYGSTTGRKRQVDFLNLDELEKAMRVNGVTDLFIAKMDVLQKLNCWKLYQGGQLIDCETEEKFKEVLSNFVKDNHNVEYVKPTIHYFYSPKI